MADLKVFVQNNMVNFQQTGDKTPYGRAKIEPRYTDTTVSFVHDDENYLCFENKQEQFLFSEIKDESGSALPSVGTLKEDVQAYLSDKVGNFKSAGGGTASTTTVDTSSFNNNLSAADDTVQKALDTIDDLVLSGSSDTVIELTFSNDGYNPSNREYLTVDTTLGNVNINLSTLASSSNHIIGVKKTDSSGNKVIINANGSELIDNANTFELLSDDQAIVLRGGPTIWTIW